jgi:long-chain alkane monooxygenase
MLKPIRLNYVVPAGRPTPTSKLGEPDAIVAWKRLAVRLEVAGFEALVIDDVPDHDGSFAVPIMTSVTRRLGFVVPSPLAGEHPFSLARRFSTLDHLTEGRIAWHSELPDGAEAEDRAHELVDVAYRLWEASWEDDAVPVDRDRQVFTEPDKVHEIGHDGRFFRVSGPHLCAPSAQRTPVLSHSVASEAGHRFAARHAECVRLSLNDIEAAARTGNEIRSQAAAYGRNIGHPRMYLRVAVAVARTEEEVRHLEAMLGWPVDAVAAVGTTQQVADRLVAWMADADLDGFDLTDVLPGGEGLDRLTDLLVPELRRRGRLHAGTPTQTLREQLFDLTPRLPDGHPGAASRRDVVTSASDDH